MKPHPVVFAGLAVCALGSKLAQTGPVSKGETDIAREMRMTARYGPGYLALSPTSKLGNAWCLAPWSGDARPYAQAWQNAQARIDRSSDDVAREIQQLENVAAREPESALAQFRWVLAATLASKMRRIGFDEGNQMRWALALAPDPHVAEFTRLRFSMEASLLSPDEGRVLSSRLRIRWPSESSVKLSTARMLVNSRVAPDFDEAIRIADGLLAIDPNRASYVALECDVHERAWFRLHRRQDGVSAIKWNEVFERRFPLQAAENREAMGRIMNHIRGQLEGKVPIRS